MDKLDITSTYLDLLPNDILVHISKCFPTKVILSCKIETSDHDGYCSGAECEYNFHLSHMTSSIKCLPQKYKHLSIASLITDDTDLEEISRYLGAERHLEPPLNVDGSGYCENSKESEENGLYGHDYKITPIFAELI